MKILYCSWYENSREDLERALNKAADEVIVIEHKVKEYLGLNENIRQEIISIVVKGIDIVISFDFIPILSEICNWYNIQYVSWIYDWPNYTLFCKEVYNKCNRIFLFERNGIELLSRYNIGNIQYSSLAVDTDRLDRQLGKDIINTKYDYDVSFVGNMNTNLNNILMSDEIPSYYEGYINGLAQVQQKTAPRALVLGMGTGTFATQCQKYFDNLAVEGVEIDQKIVDKEWVRGYLRASCVDMDNIVIPHECVLAAQINKYITGLERTNLLNAIADKYNLDVFTGNEELNIEKAVMHKSIDYYSRMPEVFRKSKINLNMTLRSITSGISLRVYDILGAGGFCLTNYQEDIAKLFKDGEELVMFTDENDMLNKLEYYLLHEEERMAIALNGHKAVKKFSYDNVLEYILKYIALT